MSTPLTALPTFYSSLPLLALLPGLETLWRTLSWHFAQYLDSRPACSQVVVATGFIAKNPAGQVTTLRRNGSDYSATIMGALVQSSNIIIWTDVDGVYSADPRKVHYLYY